MSSRRVIKLPNIKIAHGDDHTSARLSMPMTTMTTRTSCGAVVVS
jgi:hypothetical protein